MLDRAALNVGREEVPHMKSVNFEFLRVPASAGSSARNRGEVLADAVIGSRSRLAARVGSLSPTRLREVLTGLALVLGTDVSIDP